MDIIIVINCIKTRKTPFYDRLKPITEVIPALAFFDAIYFIHDT